MTFGQCLCCVFMVKRVLVYIVLYYFLKYCVWDIIDSGVGIASDIRFSTLIVIIIIIIQGEEIILFNLLLEL